jgi:sugar phosphate isomerase/epimerase
MDTHDSLKRTLPEQAALLKELGYSGAGHLWLDNVQERLETLDTAGLKLFQITMQVSMKEGAPPYDRAKLEAVLPLLKGRGVQLCLLMQGMPPSDPAGDARGVDIVREIADLAKASGTEVLLYPHAHDWMEKVSDAMRIAEKADRPNVGVMFNLCHWLKVDQEENLRPVLESALPRLRAVSINGADRAEAIHAGTGDWLQPLDKGSYDVSQVLRTLAELGYKGPVGLQCWGIGGDARDHLTRSMAAWKRLNGDPAQASSMGDGNS